MRAFCTSHCDKLVRVKMDFLQKNMSLLCGTVFQNTLDDPASIRMCRHGIYLSGHNHFGTDSKTADVGMAGGSDVVVWSNTYLALE